MNALFIIRGVSGSGKSFAAKAISNMIDSLCDLPQDDTGGFIVLAADDWFDQFNEGVWLPKHLHTAHEWCRTETQRYLEQGCYVCVCNTFTTYKEIAPYTKIAADLQVGFVSLIADTNGTDCHNVPTEILLKQAKRFQFGNRYMQNSRE